MQFTTNKIHLGKVPSFDEIVAKVRGEKIASANTEVVKTASAETSVKVAEQDEGPSSGQLDVEPLHQEGESTNQDSVAGGKDNEDSASTATVKKTNPDDEGKDSGQPAAEAKLTNDPKVDKDAKTEEKVEKKAEVEPEEDENVESEEDEDKEAKTEVAIEKEAGKHKPDCDCNFCKNIKGKSDDDSEEKEDEKEDEKDCTLSASSKGLVKIANLTSAEKGRLKEYWKNLYPADYVDAMVEDL